MENSILYSAFSSHYALTISKKYNVFIAFTCIEYFKIDDGIRICLFHNITAYFPVDGDETEAMLREAYVLYQQKQREGFQNIE